MTATVAVTVIVTVTVTVAVTDQNWGGEKDELYVQMRRGPKSMIASLLYEYWVLRLSFSTYILIFVMTVTQFSVQGHVHVPPCW